MKRGKVYFIWIRPLHSRWLDIQEVFAITRWMFRR